MSDYVDPVDGAHILSNLLKDGLVAKETIADVLAYLKAAAARSQDPELKAAAAIILRRCFS